MRRAIPVLALIAGLLLPWRVLPVRAAGQGHDVINGIGLIDYGVKPTFKVGDWARYKVSGKSEAGVVDNYTVTVLIGGEEQWWGEDCFWVETWTEPEGKPRQAVASCMSYDVFRDSTGYQNMQYYVRKTVDGLNADGQPEQTIFKRPTTGLRTRSLVGRGSRIQIDTVGTEAITVPAGTFDCRKVRFLEGRGATGAFGDSTDYTELREERTSYMSPKVPVTHIAREDIQQTFTRKTWKIGYSKDATPTLTLNSSLSVAQLVESGSGLAAYMVPERLRKSIAEQRAEAAKANPKPKPAAKKSG